MASNPLPGKLNALFTLAEDMADGAAAHETAIGILHFKEAVIRPLIATARTTEDAFANKKATKVAATEEQTVADSNGRAFIGAASRVLGVHLGSTFSTAWEPTGFPNQSTAIPGTIAERQELLAALQTYFTAHPGQEVASVNVTAARAGLLFTALSDKRSAANQSVVEMGQSKATRDVAVLALKNAMSGLITELNLKLPADDPRWFAFGLVPPAGSDQCPPPENLVLTAGVPGTVLSDWSDTPRAVRYRVFVQIVGVDPDFVLFDTVNDSDATLSGLTTGATIKVRVTAINADNAEGPPSEEVQLVVP